MSNSIRETVQQSLSEQGRGSYMAHADGVITALEEREYEIRAALEDAGARLGGSEQQVRGALDSAGLMARPEPEPEAPQGSVEQGDAGQVTQILQRIESRMNRLENAARRYGVTV